MQQFFEQIPQGILEMKYTNIWFLSPARGFTNLWCIYIWGELIDLFPWKYCVKEDWSHAWSTHGWWSFEFHTAVVPDARVIRRDLNGEAWRGVVTWSARNWKAKLWSYCLLVTIQLLCSSADVMIIQLSHWAWTAYRTYWGQELLWDTPWYS